MKLCELALSLGIEKYPEELEALYGELSSYDCPICDVSLLLELDGKYSILGEFKDFVLEAALALPEREELYTWAKLIYAYNRTATENQMKTAPLPVSDGTLVGDLMPLLILLPDTERMAERYRDRGFTEEQIKKNLEIFKIDLRVLKLLWGRPLLTQGHYSWTVNYLVANIFDHKSFNFQAVKWGSKAIYLRNKASGEHLPVMQSGVFHSSGLVFGSAGALDEEGAYEGKLVETDEAFIGHAVRDSRIVSTPETFKKSEWECVLREGDDVVSLHIPRKTRMDVDYVTECLTEGFALAKLRYPEADFKYIACTSWLLDKDIVKIIGEDKKLSHFINRFVKYPVKTNGREGLSYVFPGYNCEPSEYPEDTTLQRGVKKLMLEGDSLHMCGGIIPEIK